MILPTTQLAALLLLVLSVVCLGSWPVTRKLAGKWRFELYYYNFSVGIALCAIVAAFTFGAMNSSELTFQDNFLIAGYRKMTYAFGAGAVFNLGNLLLLGAMVVAGMAVAFPLAVGCALVIGVLWHYIQNPQGNALLLFGGLLLVTAALGAGAFAYAEHLADQAALDKSGPKFDPRTKQRIPRATAVKGVLLSLLSGVFLALFYPLLELSRGGDDAVGPYGIGLLAAGAILLSTLLYNPFLMNFPVEGEPIHFTDLFRGSRKQHLAGVLGGLLCGAGIIASLVALSAPRRTQVGSGLTLGLAMGPGLLGAVWGLLAMRDFRGATVRVRGLVAATLFLFLAGVAMVGWAPNVGGQ